MRFLFIFLVITLWPAAAQDNSYVLRLVENRQRAEAKNRWTSSAKAYAAGQEEKGDKELQAGNEASSVSQVLQKTVIPLLKNKHDKKTWISLPDPPTAPPSAPSGNPGLDALRINHGFLRSKRLIRAETKAEKDLRKSRLSSQEASRRRQQEMRRARTRDRFQRWTELSSKEQKPISNSSGANPRRDAYVPIPLIKKQQFAKNLTGKNWV